MYWPKVTSGISSSSRWVRWPRSARHTRLLGAWSQRVLLLALVGCAPVTLTASDPPQVQFDTGYLVSCYEVPPPQGQGESASGHRWVEARFRVSALVPEGILDRRVQYMYQFVSPLGSVYVMDYSPKTSLATDLAGNVGIEKKKEANKAFGINLSASFDHWVKGSGGADWGVKDTSQLRYELKPRMEILLASGTINRGTGAYFKMRSSSDTSLEGDREFTMTFRVPSNWRGDVMYLKCEAQEAQQGKLVSRGSAHFVLALHLQGDEEVREAAEILVDAEALLRHEVTRMATDIERRSLPTVAHRVGAMLALYDPRIPDQWLERMIYGPPQLDRYSFVEYLPYEVQKLARRYVVAKRQMFAYTGKQSSRDDDRLSCRLASPSL